MHVQTLQLVFLGENSLPLLCLRIGFIHDTFPIRENAKAGCLFDGNPEGSGYMGSGQVLCSTTPLIFHTKEFLIAQE